MRPSAVRVPESASLGWPGAQEKRAVCWRRCSGGATVTRPPSPLGESPVLASLRIGPSVMRAESLAFFPEPGTRAGWCLQPRAPCWDEAVRGAGCWVRRRQWPQPREQRLLSSHGCSLAGPCTHG